MVAIDFISVIIDVINWNFSFSLLTIHYPFKILHEGVFQDVFRNDSLLAIEFTNDTGLYLEVFFIVLIGEKKFNG